MDDAEHPVAARVVARLTQIRELDDDGAPSHMLDELRKLVVDAKLWARLEGDERARAAVADLEAALAGIGEPRAPALTVD